jgi:glycine oxidase
MTQSLTRCVVIGAGPIGLYTARVLASVGCTVTLIDNGQRGAGWASGGMLGAIYETFDSPDFCEEARRFALNSQWLWGRYLSAMNVPFVGRSLFVARDHAEQARLSALSATVKLADSDVERVDLPKGMVGLEAWSCTKDIAIEPRTLLDILRADCDQSGVVTVADRVTHILPHRVACASGTELAADIIVVATGLKVGSTLAESVPELAVLAPVKGQMLALSGAGLLDDVVRAGRIYLIPRGQHIVVGATSHPMESDLDTFDRLAHQTLFDEACALKPSLVRAQIVESWAGVRPKTPDGLPLVGYSQMPGVILATGAYRNGWLLAAGIANAVMGLVLSGPEGVKNLQPFAPNRFSTAPERSKCPDK